MGHLVDSFHHENTNSLFICLSHLLGQVIFQKIKICFPYRIGAGTQRSSEYQPPGMLSKSMSMNCIVYGSVMGTWPGVDYKGKGLP